MKLKYISIALLATTLVSCEDFLDKQPPSYVIPEDYYQTEDQLQAVCNKFYADVTKRGFLPMENMPPVSGW